MADQVWTSLLEGNLGAKRGERLLALADDLRPESAAWAREVAEAGRAMGLKAAACVYPSVGAPGREPPAEAWGVAWSRDFTRRLEEAGLLAPLLEKRASEDEMRGVRALARGCAATVPHMVVALAHFSTSHTAFRGLLTECGGTRYASMPLFDAAMLDGPLAVPPAGLAAETRRLAAALAGARRLRLTAPNGTDLSLSVEGRAFRADDGDLSAPGAFGNLPAGEAYVAPIEESAAGTLGIECSATRRLGATVRVRIENGRAVEIEGTDPYADELRALRATTPDLLQVAEVGIGTNPLARRTDNALEAEKILGTVHVAFGDNAGFGGRLRLPFHQDFVVFSPTLEADGRVLLDRGTPRW